MKWIALTLTILSSLLMLADIARGVALRRWKRGDASGGVRAIRLSVLINPSGFDSRQDQIESLFNGYRRTRDTRHLDEAILISRGIMRSYPGSAHARTLYAAALVFRATQGDTAGTHAPFAEAFEAVNHDPLSIPSIERAMFLLASRRENYAEFKRLGMLRAQLAEEPLTMICELCDRPWLEHGVKNAGSPAIKNRAETAGAAGGL